MTTGIRTEDGGIVNVGDRAYDYYNMQAGVVGELNTSLADSTSASPWFDFKHDDGTTELLNGQRICTIEYARARGFKGA